MNYSSQHSNGNFKSRNKCTKTPTLLSENIGEFFQSNKSNELWMDELPFKFRFPNLTIEMKFDWRNLQISSICSGNSANTSFYNWTHFQRKLTISGNSYKLTNEMKFFQSSFISFCLAGIQWGKSISCPGEMKFGQKCNTTFPLQVLF